MTVRRNALARPLAVPIGRGSAWAKRLAEWWIARVALLPPPVALK